MPRANNNRAHRYAQKQGWYRRFDAALGDCVSCAADDPDAHVDIIRAFEAVKTGRDPGPATRETVLAQREKPKRSGSVGIRGINCDK